MDIRAIPGEQRRIGVQISLLGALALLLLWMVAALFIAPAIEKRVQERAAQLIKPLNFPIYAVADGLRVRIIGTVPERDTRFEIRRRLLQLYPIACVSLELEVSLAVTDETMDDEIKDNET